jgi:DNA-binding NarL/FixJ family response regulator
MIRVVIADDHAIVRAGLRALLDAEADVQVVAEAGDGRAAVAAVEKHHPDVLLVDLSMPGCNGVEAVRQVRETVPATKILVLSMHAAPDYVRPALRAGALGYLVKGSGLDDLLRALRAVAAGERFLGPDAARVARSELAARDDEVDPLDSLTRREREVLQLVAEGRTNREIGTALGVSPKTADAHRTRVMQKLDLHDAQALTRFALRRGLISSE